MSVIEHAILTCEFSSKWFINEEHIEDCLNKTLLECLNYLGQDGWEYAGRLGDQRYVLLRR